ncbi:MAG: DMT family transporter [Pseudomonadota bacterium]
MDIRAICLGLVFALAWSSAFTSARIIVESAPPLLILSLRFFLSGALACGLAWALGQSFRLSAAQWRATILFGICQNALYLGLNFVAMQSVEASLAAIIASAMPLLVAGAGWILFRERVGAAGVGGLVVGTGGVILIMGARLGGGADSFGIALCILGVIALTAATLALRQASSGGNYMAIVGLQMLIGATALLPAGLALETWEVTWTPRLTAAFVYTTLVPGLLATLIWFHLVARVGAVKAATFHFLNPFFGVAIAALMLGEALSLTDIAGVVLIAGAILAVQTSRASARTANHTPDTRPNTAR